MRTLPLLLLTAACGEREEARSGEESEVVDYFPQPDPGAPQLTPAESAAAVARIEAHADSMTRVIRAGTPPLDRPPEKPASELTPQEEYSRCMVQAESLDEPIRTQVRGACERRRSARTSGAAP